MTKGLLVTAPSMNDSGKLATSWHNISGPLGRHSNASATSPSCSKPGSSERNDDLINIMADLKEYISGFDTNFLSSGQVLPQLQNFLGWKFKAWGSNHKY